MSKLDNDKQVQLVVKLPESLRDSFNKTCKGMDTTASRELREFMRKYIAKNGQAALF